jgi:probable addiction module antidote protein
MTEDLDIPDKITVTKFDSADYIKTDDDAIEYLNAVLDLNDPDLFAGALGDVVRARGITQAARDAGIVQDDLVRALGAGTTVELRTVLLAVSALGIKLVAVCADHAAEA